jgi:hypothetical protein
MTGPRDHPAATKLPPVTSTPRHLVAADDVAQLAEAMLER